MCHQCHERHAIELLLWPRRISQASRTTFGLYDNTGPNWELSCGLRGEDANSDTQLLPSVYRPRPDGGAHNENKMLQNFRMKAPVFAANPCPDRKATDQWLFLAQHVRLPTRLLDWTQSALVGLHFALLTPAPVVWIINLFELNRRSAPAA